MRFVPTNYLMEGMILGKSLYSAEGLFLLAEDIVLNRNFIKKIRNIGYNGVYIKDNISKNIEVKEVLDSRLKNKTVNVIKEAFKCVENDESISRSSVTNIQVLVEEIVDEILENKHLMVNMIDLKVFDDYTFYHCVNVATLSVVIGVSLNLNRASLSSLCLAALLHDVGKVFIPKEILNKDDRLSEEEFELIKSHCHKGWEYIKNQYKLPATTCVGILQHHERWDGSGYPENIKEDKASLFARIIAIADVYDALTSDRPYREGMAPSEAMEYVMGAGGSLFDSNLTSQFARKIAPYPSGTCVLLSDGSSGIVIENHEDCCLRPKIRILTEKNSPVNPYDVNLMNNTYYRNITITGITNFTGIETEMQNKELN